MTAAQRVRSWDPELPLFQDHFPSFPVVPGVLTLEALAQVAGKLIGYTVRKQRGDWPFPILSMMDRVKFRRFIPPSTPVSLEVSLHELREESARVKVRALVDGKWRARAEHDRRGHECTRAIDSREAVHEHRDRSGVAAALKGDGVIQNASCLLAARRRRGFLVFGS